MLQRSRVKKTIYKKKKQNIRKNGEQEKIIQKKKHQENPNPKKEKILN